MKIFLAGAVSSAKEKQLKKYDIYRKVLSEIYKDVSLTTPDDIWNYRNKCIKENTNLSKKEIDCMMVSYDLKQVCESDLIVCDLSEVSTGMGIELGVSYQNNKNIVFFYEKGSYISNMITGAFKDTDFVEYVNNEELEIKLRNLLLVV